MTILTPKPNIIMENTFSDDNILYAEAQPIGNKEFFSMQFSFFIFGAATWSFS
jgi:hypothetical protein